MTTKTKKKRAATPTERAEARAQEEAIAHTRPVLTREAVGYILACVPPDSALVLREILASPTIGLPVSAKYQRPIVDLLRALAEGLA